MNQKKGFTLIELLAVIVILAVIALIATPIIMNVIEDAKKGAAKDSAFGYIKTIELLISKNLINSDLKLDNSYIIDDNGNLSYYNMSINKEETIFLDYKGTIPEGTIQINDNQLLSADLTFDHYSFQYFNQKLTEKEKGNLFPSGKWQVNAFTTWNGQSSLIMEDGKVVLNYTGKNNADNTSAYILTDALKTSDTVYIDLLFKYGIRVKPNTTYQYKANVNGHDRYILYAFEIDNNFKKLKDHYIRDANVLEFTTGPTTEYLTLRVDMNGCTTDSTATFSGFQLIEK